MKYKFLALSVALVAVLAMVRCGGSGGSASDPNAAKATFDNPDGTLTEENATESMDEALKASQGGFALEGLNFGGKVSARTTHLLSKMPVSHKVSDRFQTTGGECASCVTGDENGGSIDFECLFSSSCVGDTGCTGTGSADYSVTETTYEYTYNSAGLTCTGDYDYSFLIDGTISGAYLDDGSDIFCADVTISGSSEGESFDEIAVDQCYYAGGILVGEDGSQIVCTAISANSDCTELCADFEDADGIAKVTCPITASDSSCPAELTGIQSFDETACVVVRDETCAGSAL